MMYGCAGVMIFLFMIGFVHTADSAMIAMYLVMLVCFYLVEQYVYLMVFTDFTGLWRR